MGGMDRPAIVTLKLISACVSERSDRERDGMGDPNACATASSREPADGRKMAESAVESFRKSLSRIMGSAGIEPATNWLDEPDCDDPAAPEARESEA
jgi:hypothetical protein